MASIYKRGKVWWIKYHVKGSRVQRSLHTTNERVAKTRRSKLEYDLATNGLVMPSETPIVPFMVDYCEHLRTIRTPKSLKNDLSYMRTFFGPICHALVPGNTCNSSKILRKEEPKLQQPMKGRHIRVGLLEEISSEMISRFITHRVREDRISPKTANRQREVLHRMFAYALKEKEYRGCDGTRSNPVTNVERRKENAPNIRFLNLDEIAEQVDVLKELSTLQAIVATLIYAGLRRSEALWLTVDDVDLDRKLIYVRAKTIDGQYWQPKTKRNRTVPISVDLHKFLLKYNPDRQSPWFFPSPRGKRWDPDNFSEDLRETNGEHGLSWSCLDFRHTFGSHLAQNGVSLYKIAELMGNSPEICRRHYAALMPEKMHDVVEFETDTSFNDNGTKEMLKQILDKLEQEPSTESRPKPKLRIVKSHG